MKDVVGSPGTWSGLALRVSQCVSAGASVAAMATAYGFSNYTAFWPSIAPSNCGGGLSPSSSPPSPPPPITCSCKSDPSGATLGASTLQDDRCTGKPRDTVQSVSANIAMLLCGIFAAMASDFDFVRYSAFCYLIASMGLQLLWSFGLACLDIYSLKTKRDLHNPVLVSLFVVGDWVTAILSFAAASASAGVTILFERDVHFCRMYPQLSCGRYELSVILAFITWSFIATSAVSMFWLLPSL